MKETALSNESGISVSGKDRDLAILQDSAQACFNKLMCCHSLTTEEWETIVQRWMGFENDIRHLNGYLPLSEQNFIMIHMTNKMLWKNS